MNEIKEFERQIKIRRELSQEVKTFGIPDSWYDEASYRCENDHVSRVLLKTDNGSVCMVCRSSYVLMTFPEDKDGPLEVITPWWEKVSLNPPKR